MSQLFNPAVFGAAVAISRITVPKDYNSRIQLDTFAAKAKPRSSYYDAGLTSANFPNPSHQFKPGEVYDAVTVDITRGYEVSSKHCLALFAEKCLLLPGAHGLTLTHQLASYDVPLGKALVSFDQEPNLWVDAYGFHRVPYSYLYSHGARYFRLGRFGRPWFGGHCLLGWRLVES